MGGRSSQIVSTILGAGGANARASQLVAPVFGAGGANARASQVTTEVLGAGGSNARVSQLVLESLIAGGRPHCSQIVIEVLIPNLEIEVPPIYPDRSVLPGLAFNVKWTPQFAAMESQVTDTLAEIDLALASTPIHDFELTYEFLRDGAMGNSGTNEFKTMFGFFLRLNGRPGRFFFKNPDDYTVTGQAIGTTDGVTNVWDIVRTFGVGSNSGTELVGGVDTLSTVNVYLDGVLQSAATYDIVTSIPGLQQLQFHSTPATGHAITMDFNYYYYCKFPETTTFEKFVDRCWAAASVKIRSCRAGA
jgi:hypothetical protein